MIGKQDIQRVIQATDILQVVSECVDLKKAGRYYKGLCPFHNEKTPSFIVSVERRSFHCFGCNAHGDVIHFVRETQNYNFFEAVQNLAQRFGVRLTQQSQSTNKKDNSLYDCLEQAAQYYRDCLINQSSNSLAKRYLAQLQFKAATLQTFGLGYAPSSTVSLHRTLGEQFKWSLLKEAGLVNGQRSQPYDCFRQRLIFPIRNVDGRTIGFGGRALKAEQQAKYINSKETAVYQKSRALFGLFEALNAIKTTRQAIVVEGYTDALRMHESGFTNAVANCGAALTAAHLRLLTSKGVQQLILLFDTDKAGVQAADRASKLCVQQGLEARVGLLSQGEDPDSFLRQRSAAALQQRLEKAIDAYSFITRLAKKRADRLESVEQQRQVFVELTQFCQSVKDSYRRNALKRQIERAFKTPFSINKPPRDDEKSSIPTIERYRQAEQKCFYEFLLLRYLLRYPQLIESIQRQLQSEHFEHAELRSLYRKLTEIEPIDFQNDLSWKQLFTEQAHLVEYLQMVDSGRLNNQPSPTALAECANRIIKNHFERRLIAAC